MSVAQLSVVGLTPCRSAASPPHERFADVTPISLRRDRPLQRLVRQRRRRGRVRLLPLLTFNRVDPGLSGKHDEAMFLTLLRGDGD